MPHATKPSLHKNIFAPVSLSSSCSNSIVGLQPQAVSLFDHGLPEPTAPNLLSLPPSPKPTPIPNISQFPSPSLNSKSNSTFLKILPPSPPKSPQSLPVLSTTNDVSQNNTINNHLHPLTSPPQLSSVPHTSLADPLIPTLLHELQTLKTRLKLVELESDEKSRWNEIELYGLGYEDILEEFYYCSSQSTKYQTQEVGVLKDENESGEELPKKSGLDTSSIHISNYREVESTRGLESESKTSDSSVYYDYKSGVASQSARERSVKPKKLISYHEYEWEDNSQVTNLSQEQKKILQTSQEKHSEEQHSIQTKTYKTQSDQQAVSNNLGLDSPFPEPETESESESPPTSPNFSEQESSLQATFHSELGNHMNLPQGDVNNIKTGPDCSPELLENLKLESNPVRIHDDEPLPENGCHFILSCGGIANITVIYPKPSLPNTMKELWEEKEVIKKALIAWNKGEVDKYGIRPTKRAHAAIIYPDPQTPLPRKKLKISLSFTPIHPPSSSVKQTNPEDIVTDIDVYMWASNGSFKNGPLDWYKVGPSGSHVRHDGVAEVTRLRGALAKEVFGETEDEEESEVWV